MKIKVRDIPHEGADFQETVEAADIQLASTTPVYRCVSPLDVRARLEKTVGTLIVRASVCGNFEFACSRCLEPIRQERTERFELFFDIDPKTEFVEIGEDIRQEIVVALSPLALLCKEGCKGLCPQCGTNLNNGTCRCEPAKSALARQLDKL